MAGGVVGVDPLLTVGLQVLVLLGLLWSHRDAGDVEVCTIGVVQQGHAMKTSLQKKLQNNLSCDLVKYCTILLWNPLD